MILIILINMFYYDLFFDFNLVQFKLTQFFGLTKAFYRFI